MQRQPNKRSSVKTHSANVDEITKNDLTALPKQSMGSIIKV